MVASYVHSMGVYFDSDVSGSGSSALSGGSSVLYVATDMLALGGLVSAIEPDVSDHHLRIGWWSLGDTFDAGEGSVAHWRDIQWINFEQTLWTPVPTGGSGFSLTALATLVRWWLSPGSSVHLHVFGS
jgi:hypothetical protein